MALLVACGVQAQTPVATLGKQRAAASMLQWEVREAGHPSLGPIVYAHLKTPVFTAVGNASVSSNLYVSCERSTAKIAIELANGRRADDPLGLKPMSMPKLTCNTLADGKPSSEAIEATWIANDLGDVMARGLWPSALRACASIGIVEEVVLPAGWARESARIAFEITPYARELDTVFARCGEPTAYSTLAAEPRAAPAPASVPAAPRPSSAAPAWVTARVSAEGRTNVRARPDIKAPLVVRLDPGDVVLVQRNGDEWWHAKSRPGAAQPFEGYIRRDRIVVK